MTHSWPPPLSAIHTPGKAEQSKFPFPNKVRHSASCRNIPPAPHNMSWLSVWGVCVPVFPVYSPSFPFLQPQQGYTVCTSWQQNWWWWGPQVPHGKAKPQSLVGCPDGVASAEAPDWYLWSQAAVGSQGAPPCIHSSCVIWLHQLRFLLKPLRSEEAFTSTLASSWAWGLAPHLLPPAWLQRGSFVESQSAQCRDGQRGHRSICHRST